MSGELRADARHEGRDRGVGGEGDHPGDRLVEDQGEGVDVGPTVDPVAERLLGRGVPGGAHRRPRRFGQRRLRQGPGQAEVGHPQPTLLVEEQVGGLHVAMDEAPGVCVGQPLGRLGPDGDGLGQGQPGPLVEHVPQRPAAQELEHQERALLVLTPVMDRQHVRVGQPGGGLGLGPEPPQEAAVGGQGRVQDLDGHTTLQCRVERREHVRRRPASECSLDPVAAGKDPTDGFGDGRHGPRPGYLRVAAAWWTSTTTGDRAAAREDAPAHGRAPALVGLRTRGPRPRPGALGNGGPPRWEFPAPRPF